MRHRVRGAIIGLFPRNRQEGAALAEYGLLVVFIAAVCFAAVSLLGGNINTGLYQLAAGL